MTISFLGPDGSGKSTIINLLQSNNEFKETYYYHLKPIMQTSSSTEAVVDPHKFPPYTKLKSYVKIVYFFFLYNSGWMKNILLKNNKNNLIIFDRYYDDILADPKRFRYGGSLVFAKFVRQLIPRPDLYFVLTCDANTIYKRKQEVTFEELQRQIKIYDNLVDGKRYMHINVDVAPVDIHINVLKIIKERL